MKLEVWSSDGQFRQDFHRIEVANDWPGQSVECEFEEGESQYLAPLNKLSNIKIYPNPTNGVFNIEYISHDLNVGESNFAIYNVLGQRLFETRLPSIFGINKHIVNAKNISSGMYFGIISGVDYSFEIPFVIDK